MFETLFGWLISCIVDALAPVIKTFMELMKFDLQLFVNYFPAMGTLYSVIRGIAMGFVVGIAIINLLKFFVGPLAKVSETPILLLVRVFIAVGMVYFGNYILELIVELFKGPYSTLIGSYVNVPANEFWANWGFADVLEGLGAGVIAGVGGNLLLTLIVVIALAINIIKMLLEIVERYVMVGVLVFTGPLGWSTLASQSTMGIFSRWINMFISQCIMMLLSAWSLQIFLSILGSSTEENLLMKTVFALAFTRVAQRFDSYLQQLGLNPATTSGNMLDEMLAVGRSVSGKFLGSKNGGGSSGGGRKDDVLGATTGASNNETWGGRFAAGGLIGLTRSAAAQAKAGGAAGYAAAREDGQSWLGATRDAFKQGAHNVGNFFGSNKSGGFINRKVDEAVAQMRHGNSDAFNRLTTAEKNYAQKRAEANGETIPNYRPASNPFEGNSVFPTDEAVAAGLGVAGDAAENQAYLTGPEATIAEYVGAAVQEDSNPDGRHLMRGEGIESQAATLANSVEDMHDSSNAMNVGAAPVYKEDGSVDEPTMTPAMTEIYSASLMSAGVGSSEFRHTQSGSIAAGNDFNNELAKARRGEPSRIQMDAHGWQSTYGVDGGREFNFDYTDEKNQKYSGTVMNAQTFDSYRKADKDSELVQNARPVVDRAGNTNYISIVGPKDEGGEKN